MKDRHDIERALLAGLMGPAHLRSRGTKPSDLENLAPSDFFRTENAALFGLLQDLEREGLPPSEAILLRRARELGLLGSEVSSTQVTALCGDNAPGDVAHLSKLVRESSIAREVVHELGTIHELIDTGQLSKVRERLLQIADVVAMSERGGARTGAQVADASEAKAEERRAHYQNPDYGRGSQLPSGLDTLDEFVRLERGQFVCVGGRPGMGKSSLGLMLAVANAAPDLGCYYASLEMQEFELGFRTTGLLEPVTVSHLFSGEIDGHGWDLARRGFQGLRDMALWVDDRPKMTVEQVWGEARKIKAAHPTMSMVVVDHVGLLEASNPREFREVAKVSHVTKLCKRMAKDLDVCVVGLFQLNRGVEARPLAERRPIMSDFRDSGSIEQDADIMLGAYRHGYYVPNWDQTAAELINLKQRNAAANATLHLRWNGERVAYLDPAGGR